MNILNILNILAQRLQSLQRDSQIADAHRVPPEAIPTEINTTTVPIDQATLERLFNQHNQRNTAPSSPILMIADREEPSLTQAQTSQAPDQQQNTTTPSSGFLRTLCCCCRKTASSQDDGNTYQTESPLQQAAP